jgi:hypothetical protein
LTKGESEEDRLEREGWSKRFVASEPRLSEAVEMYQEAGFEVHLEPLSKDPICDSCTGTEEGDDCRVCFEGSEDLYKIIFTRAKDDGF